jgi:hypothetical protein
MDRLIKLKMLESMLNDERFFNSSPFVHSGTHQHHYKHDGEDYCRANARHTIRAVTEPAETYATFGFPGIYPLARIIHPTISSTLFSLRMS